LLKIGCDLAQGYGIARPMPATDIPEWVVHWKPDKSWQTESLIEADQSSILLKSISGTSKNLTWDHRYNLGYPKIDMEHRIFLGLVGNFKEAMTQGLSKDRLISILHEIAKYADFHFASEENVMADCNYPELAQHAGLHRELLKEVNSYYSRFNQDEVEAKEVLEFLFDWFVLHTSTEDKKLAGFLNGVD
jgi:hemerythrin